jgi:hypothetical protein
MLENWVGGLPAGDVVRRDERRTRPENVKFSQELAEGSSFRAREFIAGQDARTLATDILALDQEQFGAAFRKSPMKRAKLAGLRRNAAVVLGNLQKPKCKVGARRPRRHTLTRGRCLRQSRVVRTPLRRASAPRKGTDRHDRHRLRPQRSNRNHMDTVWTLIAIA